MMAISASRPPANSTKRRNICGEFSFSSAPPIGMIQPRSEPSATLLAHMLFNALDFRSRDNAIPDPGGLGNLGIELNLKSPTVA